MQPGATAPATNTSEKTAFRSPGKDLGKKGSPFYVPPILGMMGGLVYHFRNFWIGLGRLESSMLAEELSTIQVKMPIYVCGLARSGSTLLHEIVTSHPGVATLRAKDYPMVFTPAWWRQATAKFPPSAPRERAHGDGILVSSESPDSTEEIIWMAFFPRCHDPKSDNRLQASEHHQSFETFYPSHIQKLLFAEHATRYSAKANYHIARIPYLLRLFPDAKFLLPVREPAGHIASLVRQHDWFSRGEREHPRALALMQRSGHYEFGLDRRPMNLGESERVREIEQAWAEGKEVLGWARYWSMVYDYLARLLAEDANVRAAVKVVRFETLCETPAPTLREILNHCQLPQVEQVVAAYTPVIRAPDYYKSPFSSEELDLIRRETAATARLWGY